MNQRLVLASNNAGKLREFSQLFKPFAIELIPQGQLGISAAEEPFDRFIDNALAKARHASKLSGLPAIADDSGICVDALGGAPGVRSARFAGEHCSDTDNNQKLLSLLVGHANRRAHYVCALVVVRDADDPNPIIVETRWDGEIIDEPRGQEGFGYDPYFYLPQLQMTAAELSPERKNAISHRGQALVQLMRQLQSDSFFYRPHA
ncbi:RdgB/HAM1 family non-canonical purine NTP pyrophosphatase [Polynucleobacter sp. MWH-UH24A]|uniref:RdgB/HAM1 family non-canonical purine NTP pyrophosphatase n=1 Tax=Polynucleobacter sp. MWH-UH24A TaxID=2689110 RepID=UPI001BFD7412|nr:RdgB/HAM1 family non-canonical purine NTP pyrophosphatase [Polynucleobacter sp. MWH-UH24A]QWD75510.1 RdgB/HAM1 family non-canonical purine NTP pyrophosphatase [Polynucleobacter sp. MWH-UH24A]